VIYETKLQRHITALMRKAYNAGHSRDYLCFDTWMSEAEGVPDTAAKPLSGHRSFVVLMPLRIQSRANLREHWRTRSARDRREKRTTALYLSKVEKPALPVKVTLTRLAPRSLDSDNLAISFKAVRDAVAEWLGADDRDGSGITWAYEQARPTTPKTYAAQILIEPGREE
jgi:hypothetical protein